MKLVFLYSDVLFWLLLLSVFVCFWKNRRNAKFLLVLGKLQKNAVAVSTLTILAFFLGIALLDSLHFRPLLKNSTVYSVEAVSLLDLTLPHLKEKVEKTYSAPFATRLLSFELLETKDGLIRAQPRLKWGGAHLQKESEKLNDILKIGFCALLAGGAFLCVLFLLNRFFQKKGWLTVENRAFKTTFALLFLFSLLLLAFSFFYHPLGTDKAGQDVLYQILKSIRVAILIGTLTTFILLPFALILGVLAGYFSGWVDDGIQYLYTVLNAIPSVLLIAASVLMMQVWIDSHPEWFKTALERADLRFLALCAILGMTNWTSLCRLLRAETLKLREMDYVLAARAFGAKPWSIIIGHIVPNLSHLIIISLVMDFSALVLSEAVLSYVGIGVDPSMVSFGTLINNARLELGRDPVVWWILLSAFSVMLLMVLSANLFADALREALNPRE